MDELNNEVSALADLSLNSNKICALSYITCLAAYGSCSATDRKALQRVVKTAERITGSHIPSVQGIYNTRCLRKAQNIVKDHSHPGYGIFTLLSSDRRYRIIRTRTIRLTISFFPQAVRQHGPTDHVDILWSSPGHLFLDSHHHVHSAPPLLQLTYLTYYIYVYIILFNIPHSYTL